MATKIILCESCKYHPFQDRKYGSRKRVHNSMKAPGSWRCTVCSNVVRKDTPLPKGDSDG